MQYVFLYQPGIVKESDGPFPWKKSDGKSEPKMVNNDDAQTSRKPEGGFSIKTNPKLDSHKEKFTGLTQIVDGCDALGCIYFDVPPVDAVAGKILQHATRIVEKLFLAHSPMTFKIGFTHNPIWRWTNKLYGYKKALEKWEHMTILLIRDEPYTPAMLEACLIDKFGGNMAAYHQVTFYYFHTTRKTTKNKKQVVGFKPGPTSAQ